MSACSPRAKAAPTTNGLPHWNLKDLLRHPDKELETRSQAIENHVQSLENLRRHLSPTTSVGPFLKGLRMQDTITEEASRLAAYAQLWFAQTINGREPLTPRSKPVDSIVEPNGVF